MRPDWIPDASALSDLAQCRELFRVRHGLGLDTGGGLGAAKGTAIHAADEVWFSKPTSDRDAALAALRAAWSGEPEVPGVTPPQNTLGFLAALYEDYMDWWPRERDDFEVLANEAYIEANIGDDDDPFHYCGIRDRLIAHADGHRYIMDTKGTGSYLNDAFFDNFVLSWQQRGYVALQRAVGEPVDGVFINAFCWRKSVGKQDRFARRKFLFPEWQLDDWEDDARHLVAELEALTDIRGLNGRWPQTGAMLGNCRSYYGAPCPLLELCQMDGDSATEEAKQRFRFNPWNPKAKVEK